jgi:glycosyltransferase involved in cell wall biosynthesis
MSRILEFGAGPLPHYAGEYISGLGIGTWILTKPLLRDGHTVALISFEPPGPRRPADGTNPFAEEFPRFRLHPWDPVTPENFIATVEKARGIVDEFRPDAIVTAATPICSQVAVEMPSEIPLWADLHGAIMPELQAKVSVVPDQNLFRAVYRLYFRLLRRGDRFSAVSEPQRKMVIGELGMVGRLNRENFGTDLVSVIPIALDPEEGLNHDENVIRGALCGKDDFVILWSGGYNTWADVETLFAGVDAAMARNPRIHYVSTGGGIRGHSESGYERLERLVSGSSHKDRYHLLGWLPFEKVHNYYIEADLGINVDLPIYESEFGARTRFLPWCQTNLPILTTVATEISRILVEGNLALGVPPKDARSLTDAILQAEQNREENRLRGVAAREFAVRNWSMEKVT